MHACLQVFETEGWSALSARRICEVAGLTRRYFYESFDDLDALLAAVYASIAGDAMAATKAAANDPTLSFGQRIERAAADSLATLDPPVRGRFLIAVQQAGGPVGLDRNAVYDDMASLVRSALATSQDGPSSVELADASIAARMVVGAVLALVDGWLNGEVKLSREEVCSRAAAAAIAIIQGLSGGPS